MSTLKTSTQSIIQKFEKLPFDGHTISCPYFNNKRAQQRAALRVMIGKGTVEEIAEEADMIARKKHIDLYILSDEQLKHFLVHNHLGIDCSAFAYYILAQEYYETKHKDLKKQLYFPHAKNPLRKLLIKLRPVENISVRVLAHEKNAEKISLKDIQAGDMIIMMNGGPRKDYNHILVVTDVQQSTVNYVHSFAWPSDGEYNHGIKHGTIAIIDPDKTILDQQWEEQTKTGQENWTYMHGRSCEKIFVARLR